MDNEKNKFVESVRKSIEDNTFAKIKFGKYRGDDREFENIFVTRIATKEGQMLAFKFRYKTKDTFKNFETGKGLKLINEILGKDFLSATLFTTLNDFTIDYSKKRVPKFFIKKPTLTSTEVGSHNSEKSRFVDPGSLYLYSLGISTREGKVKSDMYGKFRQVDKFIEIIDSLFRASGLTEKNEIKIADMGSGKSYMTFALYDYFKNKLNKVVHVKGIEQRKELVDLSNKVARASGFADLVFEQGEIKDLKEEKTDIVVALHACDTATDDAILKAVNCGSEIIVLAPCCHKYLRRKFSVPENLNVIFRHGILNERIAVSLTDGLRSLMLESLGYETKVFEFISQEHTAKNTMITAVKKSPGHDLKKRKIEEINNIKNEFSLKDFYLDELLS